ncbi:MAG: M23 family metallopeptidase [Myxococcota bacterium]|jgi:murein DD-endopeptidase MepM/ murein hydrolase activator NlpD|nr:M23 family metallopeptidase [Myxococcota bacterium]
MAWPSAQGGALESGTSFKQTKTLVQDVWPPREHLKLDEDSLVWDTGEHEKYILLQWPIEANAISSLYGHRVDPLDGHKRFHYGLDLVAVKGTVIGSAAAGDVVKIGHHGGHGKRIILRHLGGYFSSYSHLSRIDVREGDKVHMGQRIGAVGSSGRSTGPHLHLEIWHENKILNPLNILGRPVKLQ